MKNRLLLSLAIACTGLSAQAQSTVTLYGRLNTTLESQKDGNANHVTALNNNASRFGMRGTEDLGDGMKASFVLESGFNVDTGASTEKAFFGRQSSVEVSAGWGSVRLGNWLPGSYLATADYISMHNHDTGRSSDALYAFGAGFPRQNKMGYFSPNMGGFTTEASYSLGEGVQANALDLSGNYVQGPVHLGAGYTSQGKGRQLAARGLYFVGPLAVGAYVQRENRDDSTFGKTRNIYRLSGMYALGLSEFHLNVGGTQQGGTQAESARQYTLGYNYNLSKRTKIYTYYTAVNSKTNVNSSSSLAFGLRHNF